MEINLSTPALKEKKVVIFDLDGTLTESKMEVSPLTAALLRVLLQKKKVAVIGGGKYESFKRQLLRRLDASPAELKNLFLFPMNATARYGFNGAEWKKIYAHPLAEEEKNKVFRAFELAFRETGYRHPADLYGEVIEDRGSEITFSAHGQEAPLQVRERWNKEQDVRPKLAEALQKRLPEFEVNVAGTTSIDVTRKDVDKAYGIRQIEKELGIPVRDMVFVGDALFPGRNDYDAIKTGIDCVRVTGPDETNRWMESLLAQGRSLAGF